MYLVAIFYSPITESNGFAISLHFYGAAFCVNYSLPSGYLNYIPLRAYFSPVTIDRYMVLDSRLERLSPGYKSGVLPTELIQHIKLNNRLPTGSLEDTSVYLKSNLRSDLSFLGVVDNTIVTVEDMRCIL